MALAISRYAKNNLLLCDVLNCSEDELKEKIKTLKILEVIEEGVYGYKLTAKMTNLPSHSPLSKSYRKLARLKFLTKKVEATDFSFNAFFSADEETADWLKLELQNL